MRIEATAREVFDVSGAGDTVLATFACAITAGMTPLDAATLANAAAGIVVGKRGTATVSREELMKAIDDADPHFAEVVSPKYPKVIGFANGCFDLLHAGHISLLKRARAQCDYLIVAINSDASVRRLKGHGRPVQDALIRAKNLRELDCVDTVLIFEEDTPLDLIKLTRPKVLFRGQENEPIVGAKEVMSWGGKVVTLPKLEGYSTTTQIAAQIP
jgi:D-beta-D-heptose 7-phosphate kinase/D-beta-D-heptose 1-phosphate adenosyltransferase